MRNASCLSFIGQGCWPKWSRNIPTHLHMVRSRMCHLAAKCNSELGMRGRELAQLNEKKKKLNEVHRHINLKIWQVKSCIYCYVRILYNSFVVLRWKKKQNEETFFVQSLDRFLRKSVWYMLNIFTAQWLKYVNIFCPYSNCTRFPAQVCGNLKSRVFPSILATDVCD